MEDNIETLLKFKHIDKCGFFYNVNKRVNFIIINKKNPYVKSLIRFMGFTTDGKSDFYIVLRFTYKSVKTSSDLIEQLDSTIKDMDYYYKLMDKLEEHIN